MYDGASPDINPNVYPSPTSGPTTGRAMVFSYWLKRHWKLLLIIAVSVLVIAQTIFQIVYPSSRLIPGTKVDGVNIGGLKYADATKKLNDRYGALPLNIYFGKNEAAFQSPKMSEVGIAVNNEERLKAISYPFYLRFVPGSIWWASSLSKPGEIQYVYDKNKIISYTIAKVGESCSIPPINASLKLVDSQLQLVPSISGGQCDINDFQEKLAAVKPDVIKQNQVRIAIDDVAATISDELARDLALKLNNRMLQPMPMAVDSATASIPGRVVLGWLDFVADTPQDSSYNNVNKLSSLKFAVNAKRAEDYLNLGIAAKLIQKPGVTYVSTTDFTETSRKNGSNGRTIDMDRTVKSIEDYINNKTQQAVGLTKVVGPSTVATRTYTPTSVGFAALLAQYDEDNPGAYSAVFTELSGAPNLRNAQYRGDARMPAAGIHSLYIAYTEIMDEYAGITRPVDKISGTKDVSTCFKLMLQEFDEGCRKGFYDRFGFAKLKSYGGSLGLSNTVFNGEDTQTSANDLQKVMNGLKNGQIGRQEGGARIMSALQDVRDNAGIPKGTDDTRATHVIGEADMVFNDSAIVNSKYGDFILTIMSNGAGTSWEKVSGLAKKVLDLKAVKPPKDAR